MNKIYFELEGKFSGLNQKYNYNPKAKKLFLSEGYRNFKELVSQVSNIAKRKAGRHEACAFAPGSLLQVNITIYTYKDIDAFIKAILDGMEGVIYNDDKMIVNIIINKNPQKRGQVEKICVSVNTLD